MKFLVCLTALTSLSWASAAKNPAPPPGKKFALDVVNMAVALPQPDPQDRLRVLASAVTVAQPIAPQAAKKFAREGAHLEAELIAGGEHPAVSIFGSGSVDCASAATFVESLPASAVVRAQDSLLGALSACPKETLEPAKIKLQSALQAGLVAARPLMAVMQQVGPKSQWSQQQFVTMFASLPADAESQKSEAPNFAAMYAEMAPQVEKDAARDAGIDLLDWLGQLNDGGERNLGINITTEAMKKALGEQAYEEALRSNVVAQSAARTAGQPGEVEHPQEESVSVLESLSRSGHEPAGKDPTERLANMPASLRARQAAADGFAAGNSGNRKLATRYFDVAFSALDEVWAHRTPEKNAAAVVEEVGEAAANIDAVNALQRAQRLQDPAAQAIAMLAVARVVAAR
jgi:hypothetical protein